MIFLPQLKLKFYHTTKICLTLNFKKKNFFFCKQTISRNIKKKYQMSIFENEIYKKRIFFQGRITRNTQIRENPLNYINFLISGAGFLETLYLSYTKLQNSSIICGVEGCSNVLNSSFSDFFGFPISLAGSIIYGIILGIFIEKLFFKKILPLENEKKISFFFNFIISLQGISNIYFSLILAQILKINCQWCLLSILFTGAILLNLSLKQNTDKLKSDIPFIVCTIFLILSLYIVNLLEIYFSL